MMHKRSKRQKHVERSRWAETFKDGFDHGFKMGYEQARQDITNGKGETIDNQMDQMERQIDSLKAW